MPRVAAKKTHTGKVPAKTPRRAQADRREETKSTILDAAEKLFAEHGRDGVTLRMVSAEAGVDTALLHYYFDDLEGVFRSVIKRKSDKVNLVRNQAMDQYIAAHGDNPTVDAVFDVFLRPVFETIASDQAYWGNYAAIIGYINSSRTQGSKYMRESFDVTVHRFIELLIKIAPEVPREEIYWFYHLLSGSLTITFAQTGRIDTLSKGLCKSSEIMSVIEPMIRVYCAGFEATRARYAKASTSKSRTGPSPRSRKA